MKVQHHLFTLPGLVVLRRPLGTLLQHPIGWYSDRLDPRSIRMLCHYPDNILLIKLWYPNEPRIERLQILLRDFQR